MRRVIPYSGRFDSRKPSSGLMRSASRYVTLSRRQASAWEERRSTVGHEIMAWMVKIPIEMRRNRVKKRQKATEMNGKTGNRKRVPMFVKYVAPKTRAAKRS